MAYNNNAQTRISTRKVLSIQSHVVHGYVGNKAATFPLQYQGWDVDALNTVQFSNHPGYGHFTGFRYDAGHLCEILEQGLANSLEIQYDAVLMGYLPDVESLRKIGEAVGELCKRNPHLKWVLDPVLGDNGKLYVSAENVEAYKHILRNNKIHLVTPNQFEMETLTGVKIEDLESLKLSIEEFQKLYPLVGKIVVTSLELKGGYICACCDGGKIQYALVPRINAHFSGTGDLFSALLLNALVPPVGQTPPTLAHALTLVISLVDLILQRTLEFSLSEDDVLPVTINDLKLIQCRDLLAGKHKNKGLDTQIRLVDLN
ncbi:hypothetical protein ZYGR_0AK03600 [Zygosaccharomyces rouxii]|uniref:pyridoxal kinase n=1 Tax=Zygosaccharomyces rouxii TaxID=4956 RepID=A0A1Q3ADU9_ZYGRO|nr:hypothetical protein ZYGR_0AK03600 [Zygosaccharomyces rouxii]